MFGPAFAPDVIAAHPRPARPPALAHGTVRTPRPARHTRCRLGYEYVVGLADRFRRRERSPDGTDVLRHVEVRERPLGVSDTDFTAEREAVYERVFGECSGVHHELIPQVPHIDVYDYGPQAKRWFHTLVTGGMSDVRMNVPRRARGAARRAELVLYADEPRDEYVNYLRLLAALPHMLGTWFGPYHTAANGDPPEPFFEGSRLDSVIFLPPIWRDDHRVSQELVLDGDRVDLLWPVPITAAEAQAKLEHGVDTFIALLDHHELPLVLDIHRRSMV
jgi:hypothetical protein